jgi:hypothetical protein
VAPSFFKSVQEEPWDKFSHRLDRAIQSASGEFRRVHNRRVALGSPVRVTEGGADLIRLPVEVRGGTPEYAVAYINIQDVNRVDERRVQEVANEAVRQAAAHPDTPPPKPGDVQLSYP